MANTKISALASGNPAQSGDIIPIDRAGANFGITAGSIVAGAAPETLGSAGGYKGMTYLPTYPQLGWYSTDVYNCGNLGGNGCWGFQFDTQGVLGVNHASISVFAAAGPNTMFCGVYSLDRLTLLQEFIFPMSTTGVITYALPSTFNLLPGSYWYVWGVDNSSGSDQVTAYTGGGGYTGIRGGVNRFGYKGGIISGGHLVPSIPAGAWNADNGQNIPVVFLEP